VNDPRYPVGELQLDAEVPPYRYPELLDILEKAPAVLREAVAGLSDEQLDTPYRDGGWTVRQVVHHLADSHMNAYCRVKLALTEQQPTIKTYEEAKWAELADSRAPIDVSLKLLESLHDRWLRVWRSIPASDFRARSYMHPEYKRAMRLDQVLAMYAWHCRHHTAHITADVLH
jgi:uncharacterized damage-inducible protein DinB